MTQFFQKYLCIPLLLFICFSVDLTLCSVFPLFFTATVLFIWGIFSNLSLLVGVIVLGLKGFLLGQMYELWMLLGAFSVLIPRGLLKIYAPTNFEGIWLHYCIYLMLYAFGGCMAVYACHGLPVLTAFIPLMRGTLFFIFLFPLLFHMLSKPLNESIKPMAL
jgi:hypothetical protein